MGLVGCMTTQQPFEFLRHTPVRVAVRSAKQVEAGRRLAAMRWWHDAVKHAQLTERCNMLLAIAKHPERDKLIAALAASMKG